MQTRTKALIAAGVAIVLGGTALAATSQAGGWGDGFRHGKSGYHEGRGGYGEHHRGQGKGRHFMKMFQAHDANGDDILTQAEIDNTRSERLTQFDGNQDGQLSLQEYEALWLDAMRERMVDRFQRLDDDGDAQITEAEFLEPFAKVVTRLDRNDDQQLDKDDLRRWRDRDDDDDDEDEDEN